MRTAFRIWAQIRALHSSCEEVALRISKAVKVFRAMYHQLWKRKQVTVATKVAVFRAAVLPVLLYGSEGWVLSEKERERLEVVQMKCLRTILGVTKFDHRRNEDIENRLANVRLTNSSRVTV